MALTKVSRGLLSTGIVDNSNATAITLNADESATFAGNVGIGVSSPTARLSLPAQASGDSGVARFAIESAVDSNDFTISQYEDGSGTYTLMGQNISLNSGGNVTVLDSAHKTAGVLFDGRGNGQLQFYTGAANASSSKMTIDSSGAVAIGSSSATARLEVTGAFAYASGANSLATSVSKAAARINGSSDASTSLFFGSLTNDAEQYIQSSNGAGSAADDIALNPYGGNVGIGRTPSERLDVDGAIQINRTGDHPAIRFMEDGATRGYIGSGDWAVTGGATGDFGISSVGNLLFGTSAGAERFRIDSTGNLTGSCFHATTSEYVGNLDNLKTTGFYRSQNNTTNNPSQAYYSVIVYGNQGNVTAQIATLLSGPATYVRSFNTVWTSWVRIDD